MKEYETIHLVKGEDLNHHETLFAARATEWLIEAGFVTAACEHGNSDEVVLRNLHNLSFSKPVQKGSVVKFISRVVFAGSTSLMVAVQAKNAMTGDVAVEAFITFVTIEQGSGKKKVHNVVLDEAADEEEMSLREKAEQIRNFR